MLMIIHVLGKLKEKEAGLPPLSFLLYFLEKRFYGSSNLMEH